MSDITTLMMAGAGVSAAEETDENFNQTVLLLHGDGSNGAQNNTFLDSSTNNFTITRNGNTTQGTFSPFSAPDGRWANYFDGTGDYLQLANSTALQIGGGSFTVEAWIYPTASGTYRTIISKRSGSAAEWEIGLNNTDNKFYFYTSTISLTSNQVTLNAWNHVAASFDGTTLRLYVNGVEGFSGTNAVTNSTNITRIGAVSPLSADFQYFPGYISNVRVVKGTALYTSAFTPSTTPLTAVSGTSLLTCQSNRFVDNSSNAFAITRNGDVKVTPFSPFAPTAAYDASVNGGSGYFDGTGDFLTFTNASEIQLTNSAAWTIEFWVYPTTTADQDWLLNYTKSGTFEGYGIGIFSNNIRFWDGNAWTNFGETIGDVINQWTHVAVTYEGSGSTRRMFINGKQFASAGAVNANINRTTTGDAYFGSTGTSNYVNGWMTGLRIVKGSAIWTADFTPPTAPPTNISGTGILLNFTNAGIFDNTGKNNLETVGNAQIDTTTKKYGTGSMEFDGTGDYLVQPTNENYGYGTGDFTIEFWLYLNSVATQTIVSNLTSDTSTNPHLYLLAADDKLYYFTASANRITGPVLTTGVWYHIALCRASGSTRLFVDGTQQGSTYADTNNYGATAPLGIGTYWNAGSPVTSDTLNGLIDDLRITKGVARYTTTFTPPTKAFADL